MPKSIPIEALRGGYYDDADSWPEPDDAPAPSRGQHAPTPWRVDVEIYLHFADDNNREELAIEITNADHSKTYGYMLPEFAPIVVKAVNSHEKLVDALTDCLERLQAYKSQGLSFPITEAKARNALTEVEK